jgi:hypothetical protein
VAELHRPLGAPWAVEPPKAKVIKFFFSPKINKNSKDIMMCMVNFNNAETYLIHMYGKL